MTFRASRLLLLLPSMLVILAGAALYTIEPLPLRVLRNALFDQYQRWQPRVYQPAPVRIVAIDDESLKRLGQWPWPRTRIAELIERLRSAGAAAVAFDVIFAEPDRTSPQAMLSLTSLPEDMRRCIAALPDHDQALAQTIKSGAVVLGFALEREGAAASLPTRPFRFATMGTSPLPYVSPFARTIHALPALDRAAAGNGALTFLPDADGVVRRVPLLLRVGDTLLPSLSAEALRVAQDAHNYIIRSDNGDGSGIQEVRIGALTLPTTSNGEIWVHYSQPVAERTLPAWKVLAGQVPPAQLAGNIVFIGATAQGLMDLRFNPFGHLMPGVEAHAQALEQVLTDTTLTRPSWARGLELFGLLAGGLVVAALALGTGALASALATALLLVGTGLSAWWIFGSRGLLLDPLNPGLVVIATFIVASLQHHMLSERRQRWVRQAFARYVSPNLVAHLVDSPGALELGGRRQECSFVFTDLAGFTALMEKIDPIHAVAQLNEYLDGMIAIAFAHQGTLDRIVGDAVAIMFSAPIEQPDHRQRALDCALAMHAFSMHFAAERNALGVPFGQTRIGVHSGEVIVGNFGGSTIFDYRALGDPVNTASRLESVNKHLGTLICISESTLVGCPDALARPVGRLVLKGKSIPLQVFEPSIGTEADHAYVVAYALMETDPVAALAAFERLALSRPDDPLVALHYKRLRAGERGDQIIMDAK
jgi:adenylate cyclase